MKKLFGKIFGSENVVSNIVRGVTKGADNIKFTEQEQKERWTKLYELYEPFKLAQRLLALTVSIPYVLAWSVVFVASFWMDDISKQTELLTGDLGNVFLMINIFYFGGGAGEGLIRQWFHSRQEKKKNTEEKE